MPEPTDGVLLVSKPLRPPFADGSTVLVRDLVQALDPGLFVAYFGDPAEPLRAGGAVLQGPAMGHAPTAAAKARILLGLLHRDHRQRPLHLFFTPNRVTSAVVSLLRRLQPRRRMIQSVMSAAGLEGQIPRLRGLNAIVALSDHTRARLVAGLGEASRRLPRLPRIIRIYPGVALGPPVDPEAIAHRRRILYAGDLDRGVADRLLAIAGALDHPALAGWTLTIACRPKGEGDQAARQRLREGLGPRLARGQVELLGTVTDMPGLLGSAGLQLFVADHVRRKVDLPLVLLEGLAAGVGLVALDFAPVAEIFARAADHGLSPGIAVLKDAAGDALRQAVIAGASGAAAGAWAKPAQRLIRRVFSREGMAAAHAALYRELAAPPTP